MDYSPILISLKTGICTIVICFVLGTLVAYGVYKIKYTAIKIIVDGLLTLPLVLPPTVAGFFLLFLFGVNGIFGKPVFELFGYRIAFSWLATVIAATVIAFPLMYRSAKAAFENVDEDTISVARTLGMSEWMIFIKVIIPESMYGLVSGSILAFARGLGEFGATSMIAGNILGKTRTLPLAVYSEVAAGNMSSAFMYVLVILGICFFAVLLMNYFEYKTGKRKEK